MPFILGTLRNTQFRIRNWPAQVIYIHLAKLLLRHTYSAVSFNRRTIFMYSFLQSNQTCYNSLASSHVIIDSTPPLALPNYFVSMLQLSITSYLRPRQQTLFY